MYYNNFINITEENVLHEHLCCIIRNKKQHPGVESKRIWLADRIKEGHIFRKLNAKATVFIEYAPLEKAWVPVEGDNFYYIYCLWVLGEYKSKGLGRALMEYCLSDAVANGKSGVCMLGLMKQKAWLSDGSFAKKFGFEPVDSTDYGYELLALSFDGAKPQFSQCSKAGRIEDSQLTIYYCPQCPYTWSSIESVGRYTEKNGVPTSFIKVDSLQKAKQLPCVFNNWAVFYNGKFQTVNLLDEASLVKIIRSSKKI